MTDNHRAAMMLVVDTTAFPAEPGTYLLVLACQASVTLSVGSLGQVVLSPGRYAYIGSAHGPGGLRGRLARHVRASKPLRWHVDYLTAAVPVVHIYYRALPAPLECRWAQALARLPGASTPAPGFGSSDCRNGCAAHLVRLPCTLEIQRLEEMLADA